MIFGYTLDQAQKAVIAFVGFALLLVAYFVAFEPGTEAAVTAVIVYGFGVARVFMAKNHTVDDLQKAVEALATSVVGLVGLYVTVDPSVLETVLAAVANAAVVYGVYRVANGPTEPTGSTLRT